MADFLSAQQPPTKKFRSVTNSSDSDFDFKMMPPFDTPDTNNTQDLFDMTDDFNDPIDNTQQQQQQQTSTSTNQQPNIYQQPQQQRVNYIQQTRPQSSPYQTPNLQRIQTMPTSTIARPTNVISNGIQQPQQTIYTQQQIINQSRPVYARMTTPQQPTNLQAPIIRQQYTTSGMASINQNVTQMSIVKASDPNNNSVFVTNTQQPSTLVGLQPQHTVTQTPQPNKTLSTGLQSLAAQQLNQYQVQQTQIHMQQNTLQTYNIRAPTVDQNSGNPSPNYIITTQPQQQQVQQTLTNVPSSNQMIVQSSTNNPQQQHTEVQRKQFIQKQLVLLLHAHKCQQREKQTINGEQTRPSTCTLPHCSTMKSVLQHMTKCNDHKTCTVPHCVTSRQIILHWKQCNNPQCPICQPLKTPSTLAKLSQSTNMNNNNNIIANTNNPNPNPNLTNSTAIPTTISKEWQRRVTQEMRNHLVQKIITALIPITDTGAMRDKRIVNLANYARRVENETFEIANNQEEYFHKLAEKIYKIQKELEERREKKRQQDMQLTSSTTGQTSSTSDFNIKMHSAMDNFTGDSCPPNRTAPLNDFLSPATGNILQQQQIIKAEPLLTQANRPNSTNNNSALGTFSISNVPVDGNLSFLLNGDPINNIQTHDIMDTGRSNMDASQLKNEPMSPKMSYQVCRSIQNIEYFKAF